MSSGDIATDGALFEGYCQVHDRRVSGILISSTGSTYAEGSPVCRVGDVAIGNCGCSSLVLTGSESVFAEGKAVAVSGSLVDGPIQGVVITGCASVFVGI